MDKSMKKLTCNLCQKEYASPQSLCNHRRSKHKVYRHHQKGNVMLPSAQKKGNIIHFLNQPNSANICTYCEKEFESRHSKSRHLKICKAKKEVELIESNNKTDITQPIETPAPSMNCTANINGNNNTTNNVNNAINVTINNFNADNTSYFSDKFKERIINYFASNKYHLPIPKVVQNLKFNPNHKENNNMKITNIKSDIGQKYQDNKWIYCKKSDMIDESHKIAILLVEGWINQEQTQTQISQDAVTGFKDYLKVNKEYIRKVIFEEINKLGYIYYKNEIENELDD